MEGFLYLYISNYFQLNIQSLYQKFLASSGICTDTRTIETNCLFFALKGETFNGNTFARKAIEKGAIYAIVDDPEYLEGERTILVKDALKTLQELATYHRDALQLPIISLTGSNGKTTTKELIHAVLSKKYNCMATKGNLNNHIGVPLTLLSMDARTEIGIVEMGANHLGEIATLCEIAKPNFGYITNFGKAHLEGFGSEENIVLGKTELYRFLKAHEGKIFVNGQDPKQISQTENMDRIIFNDIKSVDSTPIELDDASDTVQVIANGVPIRSQLIGSYNFSNIAAAIAIGHYFEVPKEAIKNAIESYRPKMNRSQLIEKGKFKIILDAYNANPSSMKLALDNFLQMKGHKKAILLGDMFELGAYTEKEHQAIVDFLERNFTGLAFLLGTHFSKTNVTSSHVKLFETKNALQEFLENHPLEADLLLIKGSRGMALEQCLDFL
ncbi:MAG TPA: UDP-N-acetylmuramoyl-tripeptide--D-alanyl-D-alanine ligase [Flavobacteriaceae bacterium]|nr:UDP-N-acetylmuramoyl-tripeptide--D-alanyl-D-alanine ligase [Flavobacteriaceae bacterium]HQU20642.1 UDP-N-acetylmuramoyl-tripeptide--D-alanyl-D-alanine ligase [Flavobacteriaceae bacterium]HQU65035.1 UDP-N-acetylmuramoyl-tripeptide--D-alanyl-D-alanine ligase [Flavobacteriaceae bacterium]HRW44023.1 UDP-N-acetylmuramoyl-tripeptide--D-alanyl-D-alanine ligase [Flavobacteriaceae bacterium]